MELERITDMPLEDMLFNLVDNVGNSYRAKDTIYAWINNYFYSPNGEPFSLPKSSLKYAMQVNKMLLIPGLFERVQTRARSKKDIWVLSVVPFERPKISDIWDDMDIETKKHIQQVEFSIPKSDTAVDRVAFYSKHHLDIGKGYVLETDKSYQVYGTELLNNGYHWKSLMKKIAYGSGDVVNREWGRAQLRNGFSGLEAISRDGLNPKVIARFS